MNLKIYSVIFLLLVACSDKKTDKIQTSKKYFSIVFSHNINGETHPCGCRKFPLGGLPQVAGLFEKLKSDSEIYYVDSGDTFYPSVKIPSTFQSSSEFTAKELVKSLGRLSLHLFVPGEQDFALGQNDFVNKLKNSKFDKLLTNLKDNLFKHTPLKKVNVGEYEFYFLGIVSPDLLQPHIASLFSDPIKALEKKLLQIQKNKNTRIILLSHSGLQFDQQLAKRFPQIDWIIGAHSLSFLMEPEVVGQTKIVQGLSRNHHIGEIKFNLETGKAKYTLYPVSEDLSKHLEPNPFISFLKNHKDELEKIHLQEQEKLSQKKSKGQRLLSYGKCLECHKKQSEFWRTTAHSLALSTLRKANEENNTQCIGCHALGFKEPKGFIHTQKVVEIDDNSKISNYWKQVDNIFKKSGEIRTLSSKERKKLSHQWTKIDQKFKVKHNFSNVQCLNCHAIHQDHPFAIEEKKENNYQSRCLNCHTRDQSPGWYQKDTKGMPIKLDGQIFNKMLQKVACPRGTNS